MAGFDRATRETTWKNPYATAVAAAQSTQAAAPVVAQQQPGASVAAPASAASAAGSSFPPHRSWGTSQPVGNETVRDLALEAHRSRVAEEIQRDAELSAVESLQQPISQHQALMAERRHARKVGELEAEIARLREETGRESTAAVPSDEDPTAELARTKAEVIRLQEHLKTQAELIDNLKQAQQQQVGSLQKSRESAYAEIARLKGVPPRATANAQSEQERAATKIQAVQRGKAVRRAQRAQRAQPQGAAPAVELESAGADAGTESGADEDDALSELEQAVDTLFEAWDANGDGNIDKEELRAFLADLFGDDAASQEDVDDFMGQLDSDNDAQISRQEISAFLRRQYDRDGTSSGEAIDVDSLMVAGLTELDAEPVSGMADAGTESGADEDDALSELEQAVDTLFEAWDANGDGNIDKEELRAFLADLFGDDAASQEDVDDFMGQLDSDNDAQISRQEISAFLRRQYDRDGTSSGEAIDVDSLMVAGLTELDVEPAPEPVAEPVAEPEPEPEANAKAEVEAAPEVEAELEVEVEAEAEAEVEVEPEPEPEPEPEQ